MSIDFGSICKIRNFFQETNGKSEVKNVCNYVAAIFGHFSVKKKKDSMEKLFKFMITQKSQTFTSNGPQPLRGSWFSI